MKLTTNKALQACTATIRAEARLKQLTNDERIAPVTVHSHGRLIEQSIAELESALELAKQFQLEVQGR